MPLKIPGELFEQTRERAERGQRSVDDLALELLEKARAGGAAVDPLTLARCNWELIDDISRHDLASASRQCEAR